MDSSSDTARVEHNPHLGLNSGVFYTQRPGKINSSASEWRGLLDSEIR